MHDFISPQFLLSSLLETDIKREAHSAYFSFASGSPGYDGGSPHSTPRAVLYAKTFFIKVFPGLGIPRLWRAWGDMRRQRWESRKKYKAETEL